MPFFIATCIFEDFGIKPFEDMTKFEFFTDLFLVKIGL